MKSKIKPRKGKLKSKRNHPFEFLATKETISMPRPEDPPHRYLKETERKKGKKTVRKLRKESAHNQPGEGICEKRKIPSQHQSVEIRARYS